MREAVIVSTARTPIGRAFKGSLIEMRPDDLAAIAVKAALDKVPALDPSTVEDLMIGCAQPAGEHGYNMGRVVSLLYADNGSVRLPWTSVAALRALAAGIGSAFERVILARKQPLA